MERYVRTKSLKIIRLCTGNQCNSFWTGVIESNFRVRLITLAAACWTICNLWIMDDGRPYSRKFPLSNLDVTNAWTSCLAASAVLYLRMSLIHLRCWKQEHRTFLTWLSKFICSSNITQKFSFAIIQLKFIEQHPWFDFWSTCLDGFYSDLFTSARRCLKSNVNLSVIGIQMYVQAIATSDVSNWWGIYGEQFGAQYRALGYPILDFNRWWLDDSNRNTLLSVSHIRLKPFENNIIYTKSFLETIQKYVMASGVEGSA